MNNKNLDRKKRYYQKNRDKILKALKAKRNLSTSEPTLLALGKTICRVYSRYKQQIERLLLALLILSCTIYLVIESTRTLAVVEGHGALGKALLCELILIGLSMLPISTKKMRFLRSMALAGIFSLSLLNTIGGPLTTYLSEKQQIDSGTEQIAMINSVIKQKQTLMQRYLSLNRVSGARRLESEISSLSDRLGTMKQSYSSQQPASSLAVGLIITILFRLAVMMANVVFSSFLGESFRSSSGQNRPDSVPTSAKLYLVST